MAFLNSNFGFYESRPLLFNPSPDDVKLDISHTIFSMLDKEFSVFKHLVIEGGYLSLLSDATSRVTVFAFPDETLPKQVKEYLLSLDKISCRRLISVHIHNAVRLSHSLQNRYLLPTYSQKEWLYTNFPKMLVGLKSYEDLQSVKILGVDNIFRNGIVNVIESPLIPRDE